MPFNGIYIVRNVYADLRWKRKKRLGGGETSYIHLITVLLQRYCLMSSRSTQLWSVQKYERHLNIQPALRRVGHSAADTKGQLTGYQVTPSDWPGDDYQTKGPKHKT